MDVFHAASILNLPYVEMLLHSSELMPGGSPNFPDESSIENLYSILEEVFANIVAHGVQGVTLTEFALLNKKT